METNNFKCKECPLNFFDKEEKCHFCLLKSPVKKIVDENTLLENCQLGYLV